MRKLLASLAITMGAIGVAHAEEIVGDPAAGRELTTTCTACHGPAGISPSPTWPNLAGQQASYLAKQIMDIRDGNREVPEMTGMVANFSDQDAWDVAELYAQQDANIGEADDSAELLARGASLYRAGDMAKGIPACAACHTPTGEGIGSAVYPALAGQYTDYTVNTLQKFASSERNNDPGNMMRDIAAKMSDADMAAVANYVYGLHN